MKFSLKNGLFIFILFGCVFLFVFHQEIFFLKSKTEFRTRNTLSAKVRVNETEELDNETLMLDSDEKLATGLLNDNHEISEKVSRKISSISDQYAKILGCRKLPDILIIGFEKCGTVTLKTYMGIHPQLFVPSLRGNVRLFNKKTTASVEEYTKNLNCTPDGTFRLEKMSTEGLVNKAFNIIPNAKLIAVVKEPVERAMSHYVHREAYGLEKGRYTFDSLIASIMDYDKPRPLRGSVLFRQSLYIDRLEPWIAKYGLDKIHVVDGDNFVKNPAQELQKTEKFLGLEPFISEKHFVFNPEKMFYCLSAEGSEACMMKDKGRPHPVMSNATRKRLQDYFRPFNEKLFETLGRNFSWNY